MFTVYRVTVTPDAPNGMIQAKNYYSLYDARTVAEIELRNLLMGDEKLYLRLDDENKTYFVGVNYTREGDNDFFALIYIHDQTNGGLLEVNKPSLGHEMIGQVAAESRSKVLWS